MSARQFHCGTPGSTFPLPQEVTGPAPADLTTILPDAPVTASLKPLFCLEQLPLALSSETPPIQIFLLSFLTGIITFKEAQPTGVLASYVTRGLRHLPASQMISLSVCLSPTSVNMPCHARCGKNGKEEKQTVHSLTHCSYLGHGTWAVTFLCGMRAALDPP